VNPVRWSQIWYTKPVSCSNDCATIESYTILQLQNSPCSWPGDIDSVTIGTCKKWHLYQMVTWPLTSRDPERSRSWPRYICMQISRNACKYLDGVTGSTLSTNGLPIRNYLWRIKIHKTNDVTWHWNGWNINSVIKEMTTGLPNWSWVAWPLQHGLVDTSHIHQYSTLRKYCSDEFDDNSHWPP